MKRIVYFIAVMLLAITAVSCGEEDANLINPEHKELVISGGGEFEIPVQSSDWTINGVKNLITGQQVLDKERNPITLKGDGEIEADNGWLTLVRTSANSFIVRLKDNFNNSPRSFEIYITDSENTDKVMFVQSRAEKYKLVGAEFNLMVGTQESYTNDEGCHSLTFTNETSKEVWKSTEDVFKDVVYSSQFESDDYGAFEWADENLFISMPELNVNNSIIWNKSCLYKQGITTISFNAESGTKEKLLIKPFSTISLKGEMTYCKRAFNYILTIENESTGDRFKVKGVWRQIVPYISTVIITDQH